MRRGSAQSFSKLSVIFLLLSAFFNLTSYTFDQIIIHNEDKTRHLKQSLEIKRSDLYNLNTSLNVAQDLSYEIGFEANKFLSLISFDAKAYGAFINEEIFVDNLILNIEALDTDSLSKTYKNKLIKNINLYNLRVDNLYKVFETYFSTGHTKKLIEDKEEYSNFVNKKYKKIPIKFTEDYFKEETDRYQMYSKIYDIIVTLTDSSNDIREIYSFLQENFTNKYVEYYDSLERYSSNQNTKNYYILFSIVSQILGLTFLLLLFRNLINENI
jgi:hypothetical protein